jgi:hypothetical protein
MQTQFIGLDFLSLFLVYYIKEGLKLLLLFSLRERELREKGMDYTMRSTFLIFSLRIISFTFCKVLTFQ